MAGYVDMLAQAAQGALTNTEGWASECTLSTPNGGTVVTAKGFTVKHSTMIVPQTGATAKSLVVSITYAFGELEALEYPFLNNKGFVEMDKHIVTIEGIIYQIYQTMPDYDLKTILCNVNYQKV